MPSLPLLLIWIRLWCAANLTCHTFKSDVGCWWKRHVGQQLQVRPRYQQLKSYARGWKRGWSCRPPSKLQHLGEVIYFFLTSSVCAYFSNQVIYPVFRGEGMKCWVTAVAPLGQHAERAVKHEPCLPDPAGQDSDTPALSGLHVEAALCQNPQAPTGSFSPDPPALMEAPACAATAVSRK